MSLISRRDEILLHANILFRDQQCGLEPDRYNKIMIKLGEVQKYLYSWSHGFELSLELICTSEFFKKLKHNWAASASAIAGFHMTSLKFKLQSYWYLL